MKKIVLILLLFIIISLPVLTHAGSPVIEGLNRAGDAASNLPDPNKTSAGVFVGNIIKWMLGLIGVVLVVLIVYGGFLYMTSAGNEEQVDRGKKVLTY
ncbi:MAG: hypothetical protein ABIE68_00015, partial [bacterium]